MKAQDAGGGDGDDDDDDDDDDEDDDENDDDDDDDVAYKNGDGGNADTKTSGQMINIYAQISDLRPLHAPPSPNRWPPRLLTPPSPAALATQPAQ